ncbi:hypothetical protein [Hymenobacter canadensis]|uniref:Uncharacterized protein n=1 Tax=Hymenobacter canadensis TaxID=2999067 RepID=A0ABY7LXN0_9BACT|nr:hypothetical protein [Hymenobacter canadensis]WBA44182.1 hypothetical protein O3303_20050 [Hymenobacter canadensis]
MKTSLFLLFSVCLGLPATAQSVSARVDSVVVLVHAGSDNPELHQLMSQALHVEKWHVEAVQAQLAGKLFHLTYQEYRNGVAEAEKELVGNPARLLRCDPQGHFAMDVFARQATDTRLENQFLFAAGATVKSFVALPGQGDRYSLRTDLWPYKVRPALVRTPGQQVTADRKFPVGQKVPFLVYTLPYESDGYLLYCALAQSNVPVKDWYAKYKIAHFVVYNLRIE